MTENRKFWLTVGFNLAVFAVAALALQRGFIGGGQWLQAVEIIAWVDFGYGVVNVGQKVGLAKVAAPTPPEPEP